MVNYVSRELDLGKLKAPSYTPYIAPNIAEVPLPAQPAEPKDAMAKWNSNRQASKAAHPQPVPINDWVLYQMRFIFAADLCGDWSSFGGLSAQLNHLSAALHIATTEAVGSAFTYDQPTKSHLGELARARVNDTAGANDISEILPNEHRRFKLHAIQQRYKHPKAEQSLKTKKEMGKEKETKKELPDKPIGWIPNKEYLQNLDDERKAAAKPSRSPSRRRKASRSRSRKQTKTARSPARKPKKPTRRRR